MFIEFVVSFKNVCRTAELIFYAYFILQNENELFHKKKKKKKLLILSAFTNTTTKPAKTLKFIVDDRKI